MNRPRRYLKGPVGCLWLVVSLVSAGLGASSWLLWREIAGLREEAARARATAESALTSAAASVGDATRTPAAGSPPKLLPKYASALQEDLESLRRALFDANSLWVRGEEGFRARREPDVTRAAYALCARSFAGQVPLGEALEARVRDLLGAGAAARAALSRYEKECGAAREHLETVEAREVPGLRQKYGLAEAACRFHVPEARELLADAAKQRDGAAALLERKVAPYGLADEPEARRVAERACDLLGSARAAADQRVERSRQCNERYDDLKKRLVGWPAKRAAGEAAVRAIWAEFLPRYCAGLAERIAATDPIRPEVEKRLAAEAERYKEQDFDGALKLLDEALADATRAEAEMEAAPSLLCDLHAARNQIGERLAAARAAVEQTRACIRDNAADAGTDVSDGAGRLEDAEALRGRQEWLEALAAAEAAEHEAEAGRVLVNQRVADAARRREEEARARQHSSSSDTNWSSSDSGSSGDYGSSGGGGSSDSGGSWGDSGSDSGW
ncbi:MAG: hypothetical protein HYZ53_15460 [Planctomycetes bacterium]|nr:hypothetical protein [Planctomycetota bacterium]